MKMEQYTVIVRQDGPHYVALCLELNVASQGSSLKEARQNIAEAIREYLSYMHDIGATDEIQPVPFDLLREFLLEGLPDNQQLNMEVFALAA
jgi:predicted RNase H-like HicB family nuclease